MNLDQYLVPLRFFSSMAGESIVFDHFQATGGFPTMLVILNHEMQVKSLEDRK